MDYSTKTTFDRMLFSLLKMKPNETVDAGTMYHIIRNAVADTEKFADLPQIHKIIDMDQYKDLVAKKADIRYVSRGWYHEFYPNMIQAEAYIKNGTLFYLP